MPEAKPNAPEESLAGILWTVALTTALVVAAAWWVPAAHAATAVGIVFLGAVYLKLLHRGSDEAIRRAGLGLAGLLESAPIEPRRLVREGLRALLWTAAVMLVVFPPFWVGFHQWWAPTVAFRPPAWPSWSELGGQLLVVALPEEAFYRGYVLTALERRWPPRSRWFGVGLGRAWLVSSLFFALVHVMTQPNPARLAVFFPALLFAWVRLRTGGIGAAVLLHAASNVFASYLAQGYGLLR